MIWAALTYIGLLQNIPEQIKKSHESNIKTELDKLPRGALNCLTT
jgi:hypothetical protein